MDLGVTKRPRNGKKTLQGPLHSRGTPVYNFSKQIVVIHEHGALQCTAPLRSGISRISSTLSQQEGATGRSILINSFALSLERHEKDAANSMKI